MNRLIQKILLAWLTLAFSLANYASAESSPPIDLSKFYILPVSIEANEAIPLADADLALEYNLKVALRKQAMLQINPYIHSLSLQTTITSYSHEHLVVLISVYDEQNLIQRFELSRFVPVNAEWPAHLSSLAEDIMLELKHKMVELPCYPNCITEPPCHEQCEPQHAFIYFYPAYQPIIIETPRPYSPHYDSATKAIIHSTPSSASEVHTRDTHSDSEHPSIYQPPQSSPSIPIEAPQTPNQPIRIYQSPSSIGNNKSSSSPSSPIQATVNSTSNQHNTDSSRSQPPSSARSGTDTSPNRRVSTESPSVYKPSTSTNTSTETSNQRRSTENSNAYKPSTSSNADMTNQRSNTESINTYKPSASADTSNQHRNNESPGSNHASGRDDDSGRNKRNGKKD
mgnify:CR=1 FL=1